MYKFTSILFLLISILAQAQPKNSITGNSRSVEGSNSIEYFQNNKMNLYDIKYLKLEITAQPSSRVITGICTYKVITKQPLDTFAIELKQSMFLDSVYVNNGKQNFTRNSDHIYIPFAPVVNAATELNITFYYKGTVSAGIYAGVDANTGLQYTATLSESYQAREWFPAKQLLNDKIDSTDIWITTDLFFKAGSNGLLKQVVDLPGNRRQYQWSCRYPMNYYMPCIAVGNYLEYRNYAKPAALRGDSILVLHYIVDNQAYFNSVKPDLDKTPAFIEKFSELYGLYPFFKEKYGHVHANIGGGMEHQTMSTMAGFNPNLVSHELAHQWFGDNVTCASWSDIWLNESFATYSSHLMREKLPALFTESAAANMINLHNSIMLEPGGSVYVPPGEAYNEGRIFNSRLSYNKGAAVVHNLRFEMQSDTLFFNTLKTYQQRFKDTFAATPDFKLVAEQVSRKNLTDFFNQWIYGEGYPTYSVTYYKQDGDTLVLNISQTTSMPAVTPLFKGLMEYKISSAQGDTIIKISQSANDQTFKIYYTKSPAGVEVDPNNWVINKVGSVIRGVDTITATQPKVKIFPNPVRSTLHIKLGREAYETIQILDANGRSVQVNSLSPGATVYTFPITLSTGIYFVRFISKKGNFIKKILVSR
ncbi:MAG: M1 family aminopeptidase [Segetibacter sp.]